MHHHMLPRDLRPVHLIARGLALAVAVALAGVAGFLNVMIGD